MEDALTYRQSVDLPVGFRTSKNERVTTAEVRAVTGGDELFIGMSRDYNEHPNDLIYKMLLLSRTVTRLGNCSAVTITDINQLHARDIRALELAVYRLTYGDDCLPGESEDDPQG